MKRYKLIYLLKLSNQMMNQIMNQIMNQMMNQIMNKIMKKIMKKIINKLFKEKKIHVVLRIIVLLILSFLLISLNFKLIKYVSHNIFLKLFSYNKIKKIWRENKHIIAFYLKNHKNQFSYKIKLVDFPVGFNLKQLFT
ncbi:hypothetical protein ACWNYL_00015 [Candidatus Karelsulcia muelleri]